MRNLLEKKFTSIDAVGNFSILLECNSICPFDVYFKRSSSNKFTHFILKGEFIRQGQKSKIQSHPNSFFLYSMQKKDNSFLGDNFFQNIFEGKTYKSKADNIKWVLFKIFREEEPLINLLIMFHQVFPVLDTTYAEINDDVAYCCETAIFLAVIEKILNGNTNKERLIEFIESQRSLSKYEKYFYQKMEDLQSSLYLDFGESLNLILKDRLPFGGTIEQAMSFVDNYIIKEKAS